MAAASGPDPVRRMNRRPYPPLAAPALPLVDVLPPIRKAAVCSAVAAAARRAACERADCSFVFQSGRISSEVTTSGEPSGSISRRFHDGEDGGDELGSEVEDADAAG